MDFDQNLKLPLMEFIKQYQFTDKQGLYASCVELIPVFRVEQWLDYNGGNSQSVRECLDNHLQEIIGREKWKEISKDGFPDKPGNYIVATGNGAVCTAHFYKRGKRFSGKVGAYVTHWMPLPVHPNGVDE